MADIYATVSVLKLLFSLGKKLVLKENQRAASGVTVT